MKTILVADGVHAYLIKPFSPIELMETVEKILGERGCGYVGDSVLAIRLAGVVAAALILGLPAEAVACSPRRASRSRSRASCVGASRGAARPRARSDAPRRATANTRSSLRAGRRGSSSRHPLVFPRRRGGHAARARGSPWLRGSRRCAVDRRLVEASLEREHRVALRAWVERAQAGDPPSKPLEVLAHGLTARARWFELWLRLVDGAGGAPAIDGVGRDITERREAELEQSCRPRSRASGSATRRSRSR